MGVCASGRKISAVVYDDACRLAAFVHRQISRNVYSQVLDEQTYVLDRFHSANHTCVKRTSAFYPYGDRNPQLLYGVDTERADHLFHHVKNSAPGGLFASKVFPTSESSCIWTHVTNPSEFGILHDIAATRRLSRNRPRLSPARVVIFLDTPIVFTAVACTSFLVHISLFIPYAPSLAFRCISRMAFRLFNRTPRRSARAPPLIKRIRDFLAS